MKGIPRRRSGPRRNNDKVRIEVKGDIITRRSFGRIGQEVREMTIDERRCLELSAMRTETRRNKTISSKMKTIGERLALMILS